MPTAYGQLLEVSAIFGPGLRDGVDMVWDASPDYGHFGLDLTGQNGGVIRIESLQIEDVSAYSCFTAQISWISAITAP